MFMIRQGKLLQVENSSAKQLKQAIERAQIKSAAMADNDIPALR